MTGDVGSDRQRLLHLLARENAPGWVDRFGGLETGAGRRRFPSGLYAASEGPPHAIDFESVEDLVARVRSLANAIALEGKARPGIRSVRLERSPTRLYVVVDVAGDVRELWTDLVGATTVLRVGARVLLAYLEQILDRTKVLP